MELSFVRSVAAFTSPRSSSVRNVLKERAVAWSFDEISFDAKNASTITMRIGNAALLKNRLMRYRRAARTQGWDDRTRRPTLPRDWPCSWRVGKSSSRYGHRFEKGQSGPATYVTDNAAT